MKFFIVAILLAVARAGVIETGSKCVTTTMYEAAVLKNNIPSPYQLTIDHNTNTLFFSYTTAPPGTFEISYLNLKTNDYGVISGIKGGFASAVNYKNNIVYLGGQDGLYQFDYKTKSATKLNVVADVNIWQMFYKDGLYFTTYPDEKAFLYKHGDVAEVPALKNRVMVMAVKNNGNYVFANSSGLFIYDKTTQKSNNIADYTINGFSSDSRGKIYFSTPTGIYFIDDKNDKVEQVTALEEVYGAAIEGDGNIIYADSGSIIRLTPKSTNSCINA